MLKMDILKPAKKKSKMICMAEYHLGFFLKKFGINKNWGELTLECLTKQTIKKPISGHLHCSSILFIPSA